MGYIQSYEKLLRDTTLLLDGSEGRIGVVILVKIEPVDLRDNMDASIKKGFIEVWGWDFQNDCMERRGERLVWDRRSNCVLR